MWVPWTAFSSGIYRGERCLPPIPTNAARTQLMSLSTLDWDDSMLDLFGIRRETLAEAIYPSDHIFCH